MASRRHVRLKATERRTDPEPLSLGQRAGGFATCSIVQVRLPAGHAACQIRCGDAAVTLVSALVPAVDVAFVARHLLSDHPVTSVGEWDSGVCDADQCEDAHRWLSAARLALASLAPAVEVADTA
jgi:hypothetical protein